MISIHSPRMGRDYMGVYEFDGHCISIHSPRMGRDEIIQRGKNLCEISIHSPRMGRDPNVALVYVQYHAFQSTLPAWGETLTVLRPLTWVIFQSTLPAWGETRFQRYVEKCTQYFNPLSPHGERPVAMFMLFYKERISIHSPRMGRDHSHPFNQI